MSDDRKKQIYKNLKEISDTFHLGRNYGEEKDIEQALDYITALTEKIKELEGEIIKLRNSSANRRVELQQQENEKLKAEIIKLTENHSKLTESEGI